MMHIEIPEYDAEFMNAYCEKVLALYLKNVRDSKDIYEELYKEFITVSILRSDRISVFGGDVKTPILKIMEEIDTGNLINWEREQWFNELLSCDRGYNLGIYESSIKNGLNELFGVSNKKFIEGIINKKADSVSNDKNPIDRESAWYKEIEDYVGEKINEKKNRDIKYLKIIFDQVTFLNENKDYRELWLEKKSGKLKKYEFYKKAFFLLIKLSPQDINACLKKIEKEEKRLLKNLIYAFSFIKDKPRKEDISGLRKFIKQLEIKKRDNKTFNFLKELTELTDKNLKLTEDCSDFLGKINKFFEVPEDNKYNEEKLKNEYNTRISSYLQYKSTFEKLKKIYTDEKILSESLNINGEKVKINTYMVEKIGVNVCPYCNRDHINSRGDSLGAQMDHFYSKNYYPMFAVSLYNFIPVCATCNRIKSDEDLKVNPFLDKTEYKKKIFKFSLTDLKNINVELEEDILTTKLGSDFKILKIEDAYKIHKMNVKEMFNREMEYGETHRKWLKESFNSRRVWRGKDVNKEIDSLIYGKVINLKEEELNNIPLGKFTKDVYKQVKKLANQESNSSLLDD